MVLGVDVGGTKVAVAAVDGVTVHESTEDPTITATTEQLLDGIETVVPPTSTPRTPTRIPIPVAPSAQAWLRLIHRVACAA